MISKNQKQFTTPEQVYRSISGRQAQVGDN